MKFVPLIIRNLPRNRRRTILSVLSIAVSTLIFAALMSVPAVAARLLRDRVSTLRLICGNKAGSNYLLPAAYGETIRGLPHVSAMSGYLLMMASYRKAGELIPVAGLDPDQLHAIFPEWASAQNAAALGRSRSLGLVGPGLMKRFEWKVGDNVILHGLAPPTDLSFTIAGTLGNQVVNNLVIVPIERLNKIEDFQGKVAAFVVKTDASEFAQPLLKQIDGHFCQRPLRDFNPDRTRRGAGPASGISVALRWRADDCGDRGHRDRAGLRKHRRDGSPRTTPRTRRDARAWLHPTLPGRLHRRRRHADGSGGRGAGICNCVHCPSHCRPLSTRARVRAASDARRRRESVAVASAIGLLSAAVPALSTTRRAIADSLRSAA